MDNWLNKNSTVLGAGFASAIFQLILLRILSQVDSLDRLLLLQVTLSPADFLGIVDSWNSTQRDLFIQHFQFDFIYPAAYSVFLSSCLHRFSWTAGRRPARLLPFLAGIFDEIENVVHLKLSQGLLPVTSPWFYVGGTAARMKWLLIVISVTLLLFTLFHHLLQRESDD
jgi:hypothetical protein